MVEGYIYNKDTKQAETDLSEIAKYAFHDEVISADKIRNWMLDADGEYILVILHKKSGELIAFNDPLGKVPLYYWISGNSFIVARECKFIIKLMPNPEHDRIGWAQHLWCRHPLGKRTLYKDIHRLAGGTVLKSKPAGDEIQTEVKNIYSFNYDEIDNENKPVKDICSELIDLFLEGIRRRATYKEGSVNVISQSGGQDSRAVAVAMTKLKIPCVSATFLSKGGYAAQDAPIAKKIASQLNIPWYLFHLNEPRLDVLERMAWLKDGLNYVGMAFIISFLEEIVEKWGRDAMHFSGNPGDVFYYLYPKGKIDSENSLVYAFTSKTGRIPIDLAEKAVGIPYGTIKGEMENIFRSYPEKLINKSIHFHFNEHLHKLIYEGDDRTNFFLWHTTSFLSIDFYKYIMHLPHILKKDFRLYREFQKMLSPEIAKIPDSVKGLSASNFLLSWELNIYRLIRNIPILYEPIRYLLKGPRECFKIPPEAEEYYQQEIASESPLVELINPEIVKKILNKCDDSIFYNWWTLVLQEKIWRNHFSCHIE